MGLAVLVLGLIVFIGSHALTMARGARAAVVGRIGEVAYKIIYSLVAILGIALIAWGYGRYRATGWIDVWQPPDFMRHVTVTLMWPSIVCIAAAYSPGHINATVTWRMKAGGCQMSIQPVARYWPYPQAISAIPRMATSE